jgi:hypothetical protein
VRRPRDAVFVGEATVTFAVFVANANFLRPIFLESYNGSRKLHRKAGKRGGKAVKPGLSTSRFRSS